MKKKNLKKNLIIFFLLLMVLGLSCYLLYDKGLLMNLPKIQNPKPKIIFNKELDDVTDSSTTKRLYKNLVTNDRSMGFYYKYKITSAKNDDFRFIRISIKNYIDDNDMSIITKSCAKEINADTTVNINKARINEYIQEKYYADLSYDIKEDKISDDNKFLGPYNLVSTKDNWSIVCASSEINEEHISNKLVKAEKDDTYLYIYDKAVYCKNKGGMSYCVKSIDDTIDDAILDCSSYGDNSVDSTCPEKDSEESYAKTLSEYAMKNYEKKLSTYKHTFKKIDGEYYWMSSEITK